MKISNEDEIQDLTSEQLGKMKRRIADLLEPGETVLRGLRRLKGTSTDKKRKMSKETKQLFDQLTEDAMKPMENGDYKGYEKLAQARQGKSFESMQPKPDNILDEDFLPSGSTATAGGHSMHNAHVASSNSYNTATKSDDAFDMFGEDDENIAANLASNGVITTAAVWAIIMIHHLDCIAMHHQDNGNDIQLFKPAENLGTRIMMNRAYAKRCHRLHPMQVERAMVLVIIFFD